MAQTHSTQRIEGSEAAKRDERDARKRRNGMNGMYEKDSQGAESIGDGGRTGTGTLTDAVGLPLRGSCKCA